MNIPVYIRTCEDTYSMCMSVHTYIILMFILLTVCSTCTGDFFNIIRKALNVNCLCLCHCNDIWMQCECVLREYMC